MKDEEQSSHLGREIVLQVVGVGIMVVGAVLVSTMERKAFDPDYLPMLRMRAFKLAERFAATSAANWWHLAERARLAYEAERPG